MIIDATNTLIHQHDWAFIPPTDCKHPLLLGGFGCGKTHAIGLRWLYLIDWRAKHQKFKCKLMIVEPTYQLIRDVLVPELDAFFDSFKIKHHYHKSTHNYTIWLNGIGFVAMLRSADNPASLTGKTVSDIIIDEFDKIRSIQDQKAVWTELLARIRMIDNGTLGAVTTPEGFKYTYELWQEKNLDNPAFRMIRAKTRDNHFLPQDYIDNLVSQYDTLLAKQYLEGEFVNLNNMAAYYCFNRDRDVKPVSDDDSVPHIGIDFNINPLCSVVANYGNGKLKVFREYYLNNCRTRELAEYQRDDFKGRQIIGYPDPTGNHRETSADRSDHEILIAAGYELKFNNKLTQRQKINAVNNWFDKGRIEIDPSCVNLIKDLEQVTVDNTGHLDKPTGTKLTHISDALANIVSTINYYETRPMGSSI